MNLSIFQETKPVGSNTLVMAISKKTTPAVILAFHALPGPYTGQTQLHTFPGLQNIIYYYQLFESPDGSPTGTVRNYYDIQPNSNAYNVRDDLFLTADTSPFLNSGVNFYGPDSSLIGWNWGLERKAQGTMEYGFDYVKTVGGIDTTQDDISADGWRLFQPGDLVGFEEKFIIHFLPQLSATSAPSSGTFVQGTTLLTANTTLDNTGVGRAFLLQGGGGFIGITLPDINTVPDNEPIFFNSNGGSHINAGLICFSGQQLQWFDNQSNLGSNTRASSLYLGQCESGYIYRFTFPDSSKRWLVFGMDGARLVGETIYDSSKIPLNTVFANGQLLSRANYPRLWAWVQSLEPGMLIAESAYNNMSTPDSFGQSYNINHGRYTIGDGSTTFRLPTLWEYRYLALADGSTLVAGGFSQYQIGKHRHNNGVSDDKPAGDVASIFVYETTTDDMPGAARGQVQNGTSGNIRQGRTSTVGGPNNIPNSFGIYALIRC